MILQIGGLLLLVGVALFFLVPMWRAMQRQTRQGAWPRVQALITEHREREDAIRMLVQFRVQYEYGGQAYDRWVGVVDGTSLTMVGGKRGTDAVARSLRAFWAKHPVGSQLPVMINPENTKEAYFAERELPMRVIFFLSLAVFAVFFAVFAFISLL